MSNHLFYCCKLLPCVHRYMFFDPQYKTRAKIKQPTRPRCSWLGLPVTLCVLFLCISSFGPSIRTLRGGASVREQTLKPLNPLRPYSFSKGLLKSLYLLNQIQLPLDHLSLFYRPFLLLFQLLQEFGFHVLLKSKLHLLGAVLWK